VNEVISMVVLVVGLAVLIVGAEMLVKGSAKLARALGMSPFAIGVTVVAFGTSAPELFASIGAAIQNEPELAVGNVVGSNIANILLILGVGAMIIPIRIQRRVRLIELPLMLAITIGAALMMLDHRISRSEGILLTTGLVAYVIFIVRSYRVNIVEEGKDVLTQSKSIWVDVLTVLGGIVGLGLGAKGLVYGATELADAWGVSSGVVGATIVALGTSLPELAVTVRASLKRESDMAVGNIIGSNVFNLLCVFGITASINPLSMPGSMDIHIWIMIGVSGFLVVYGIFRGVLGRWIGLVFVVAYLAYIIGSFLGFGTGGSPIISP